MFLSIFSTFSSSLWPLVLLLREQVSGSTTTPLPPDAVRPVLLDGIPAGWKVSPVMSWRRNINRKQLRNPGHHSRHCVILPGWCIFVLFNSQRLDCTTDRQGAEGRLNKALNFIQCENIWGIPATVSGAKGVESQPKGTGFRPQSREPK